MMEGGRPPIRAGQSEHTENRSKVEQQESGVDERGAGQPLVVALRADIDALPIREEGEAKKEFLSQNDGVAHCCGHDLHTSNLMATAYLLSRWKEKICGKVVLIFQAAEETPPGGGRLVMESGLLQELGVSQIYGLHTDPFLEPGKIAVKQGAMMASPHEFTVEIMGKGGHAAAPHRTVDPIVIASQVVLHLQTIVSRNINPTEAAVVTVGILKGGSARNIIPGSVMLEGTIRTFNELRTREIFDRIRTIAEHTALAAGGEARADLVSGYPAVINHAETTRRLVDLVGDKVKWLDEPVMAGEDFAFYQEKIPGTFFFLGSGSEEADSRYSWHHPKYNVDESCLKTGISVMAALVPGMVVSH